MVQKISIFVCVSICVSLSQAWNYKEQEKWPPQYCQRAVAQSPIDVVTSNTKRVKPKPTPFVFNKWDQEYDVTVSNNGHTIHVEFSNRERISVAGGALPGTFNLFQFHFHWGAEHTIDGERKALEAHFVTFNDKYPSSTEAMEYSNGIAVLTVLYDLSDKENTQLKPIIEQLGKLTKPNQSTRLRLNPAELLPDDKTEFYRYFGSLTTPDCNDIVAWTIFIETCKISKSQVDKFKSIKGEEGEQLTDNYRKIQPLNGRVVYKMCTKA